MKDTTSVEIRKYYAANWWSVSGVAANLKRILRKGIPNLKDWRFITLTIDPKMFDTEVQGYLAGRENMRRFIFKLRKALNVPAAKWAWKFEFQSNGQAHWHIYFEYKTKIDGALLNKLWGLGRTNVKRCDAKSIHYAFKYAFKPSMRSISREDAYDELLNDETPVPLPKWFLDWRGLRVITKKWICTETGEKMSEKVQAPDTFGRVRFWQTCKGFYTGDPAPKKEVKETFSSLFPRTLRAVASEGVNKVQLIARSCDASYRKSAVVVCVCSAASLFSQAGCLVVKRQAAPSYNQGYIVPSDFLENKITTINKLKLCQLKQLNHLSISRQIQAILSHQMRV